VNRIDLYPTAENSQLLDQQGKSGCWQGLPATTMLYRFRWYGYITCEINLFSVGTAAVGSS